MQLSRIGRPEIQIVPCDVSSIAHEVVATLSEQDREREIEVEAGIVVKGDRQLLRIALDNLIGNAWKFTSKTACAKIVGSVDHGGERTILMRDNGVGFDMAHADRLFGAFQRLHTQEQCPGTGIGLATVKRIVAHHGGRIWAEAAPGLGATFFVSLPAREAEADQERSRGWRADTRDSVVACARPMARTTCMRCTSRAFGRKGCGFPTISMKVE